MDVHLVPNCMIPSPNTLEKGHSTRHKESTAHLFLFWTKTDTFLQSLPMQKAGAFLFLCFSWQLFILHSLSSFLSSSSQKSFCPACPSTFAPFPSGAGYFPDPKFSGIPISTTSSFPFHYPCDPFLGSMCFRPVKNISRNTSLRKRKQQCIKSVLWDSRGWQSRADISIWCQGHVPPLTYLFWLGLLLVFPEKTGNSQRSLSCPSCCFPSL